MMWWIQLSPGNRGLTAIPIIFQMSRPAVDGLPQAVRKVKIAVQVRCSTPATIANNRGTAESAGGFIPTGWRWAMMQPVLLTMVGPAEAKRGQTSPRKTVQVFRWRRDQSIHSKRLVPLAARQ